MPNNFFLHSARAIALTYLAVGLAWIMFSDGLISYFFNDDIRTMSEFQLYKGFFYVGVTCVILYFLIKRLADSINRRKMELELLFSNPNLGIIKLDAQGTFTHVSSNITAMTGYSMEELLGKSINHFTPDHRRAQDDITLATLDNTTQKGDIVFKKHILAKNGSEIIIKGYGMRIRSRKNENPRYIVALQNITEEARFLEALEAHNHQLKDLASQQSHLVRAPLARIMGISSLLQNSDNLDAGEKLTLIQNLEVSAEELDDALRKITQKMNSTS